MKFNHIKLSNMIYKTVQFDIMFILSWQIPLFLMSKQARMFPTVYVIVFDFERLIMELSIKCQQLCVHRRQFIAINAGQVVITDETNHATSRLAKR